MSELLKSISHFFKEIQIKHLKPEYLSLIQSKIQLHLFQFL